MCSSSNKYWSVHYVLQRSLNILAQLLGGEYTSKASGGGGGNSTITSHSTSSNGPSVPRTADRFDSSRLGGSSSISGDTDDTSAAVGAAENSGTLLARGEDDSDGHGSSRVKGGSHEAGADGKGQGGIGGSSGSGDGKGGAKPVSSIAGDVQSGGQDKFVAHMSTLTDIFKVEDKKSTKKNQAEKEKDKGFRIVSLFDDSLSTAPTTATNPANTTDVPLATNPAAPAASAGLFSFSFGGGADGAGLSESSREVESVTVEKALGESGREGARVRLGETPVAKDHQMDQPSYVNAIGIGSTSTADGIDGGTAAPQQNQDGQALPVAATSSLLWRPLAAVVTVAAGFVRAGSREEIESAWIQGRRALTQDFKRKHKDAVKGRRGATRGGHGARGAGKRRGAGAGAQRNSKGSSRRT